MQRKAVSAALCAWEQFREESPATPCNTVEGCITHGCSSTPIGQDTAEGQQQQQQQAPRILHISKGQRREVNAMLAIIGRYKASGIIEVEDPQDMTKVRWSVPL